MIGQSATASEMPNPLFIYQQQHPYDAGFRKFVTSEVTHFAIWEHEIGAIIKETSVCW